MRCPRRRGPGSDGTERWPPRRARRPGVPSFPCRSRCPCASPGYADAHPIPGGRRVLHAQTVPADRAASSRPAFRPMSLRVIELADRGRMFIRAAELARAAEALVLELRSEMEALRAHIEERQEVLRPAD